MAGMRKALVRSQRYKWSMCSGRIVRDEKSYSGMGMGKCEPGRHVVSCWPKREGMYVGVGICGSAGRWREVTVG